MEAKDFYWFRDIVSKKSDWLLRVSDGIYFEAKGLCLDKDGLDFEDVNQFLIENEVENMVRIQLTKKEAQRLKGYLSGESISDVVYHKNNIDRAYLKWLRTHGIYATQMFDKLYSNDNLNKYEYKLKTIALRYRKEWVKHQDDKDHKWVNDFMRIVQYL